MVGQFPGSSISRLTGMHHHIRVVRLSEQGKQGKISGHGLLRACNSWAGGLGSSIDGLSRA